jgi:tRNA threonylcarbamoyladenosine biosynthesis protein TsaE
MTNTVTLPDLPSLDLFAKEVARILASVPPRECVYLVTLSGELGAGKTTFVQSLARSLGVVESVQSPTFILAKNYETTVSWPKRILHIDAYRLSGFEALRPLDWEHEAKRNDTVILLEWPECVAPLSPVPDMTITLSVEPNGGRKASLTTSGEVV